MVEQLSFYLFDYFPSLQQATISRPVTVNPSVDHRIGTLNTSTGKKYAYDCGEELHGARKHLVAMARFSAEWQKAIEEDPTLA
ncbi:hypothetical protein RQP50_00075 [Paenibacillus sp. chi10]|uniref:Uncharacterized protein n=1 Tax=Paenibacillus suaedae TaxID=3077233 RepID=A0AAJ2JRU5_9BACL|nr:hypothetical protein [Paenibacillus sp. chi10]MDT8974631.1 hypothetical protein [Paenibacillus sp. chi10]